MHDLSLYEKKIIRDKEFPVQIFKNQTQKPGLYFLPHWHEHIELHYILTGEGIFYCNQNAINVKEGNLVVINSNELHKGFSNTLNYEALVMIFEMDAFSKEIADGNVIFQSLIQSDDKVTRLVASIYKEENEKEFGYKLAMKGKVYELITYLLRNYVVKSESARDNIRRKRNLNRLNIVMQYIEENYLEPITNQELAELLHVSEYRFCHLFKESLGQSPSNFINEVRLKKAYHLLEQKEMTIAEIAAAVGFQDYNNFGRLFRKYYGFAPSNVWNKNNIL
jgi:AraC-like DNA-binding protein